jgi:RHS repeat-associated protein
LNCQEDRESCTIIVQEFRIATVSPELSSAGILPKVAFCAQDRRARRQSISDATAMHLCRMSLLTWSNSIGSPVWLHARTREELFMFRTWARSLQKPVRRRPIRKASRYVQLLMEALEDRNLLTVYYFNGGNIFGPTHQQDDPYWRGDGGAWLNPFNWGQESDQGLFVGVGVPGGGDTVVFRGATEDGQPWTVFSKEKDAQGNYLSAKTGGRSAYARESEAAGTLNLDRNWGGFIQMQDGSTLSVSDGRWQSGQVLGNATSSGNLLVAPDPNAIMDISDGTFTNSGTITITAGSLEVGRPTGVVNSGGTLVNLGTVNVAGGQIVTGGPSLLQNDGLLTGSSGQVHDLPIVSSAGSTIESTGTFSLPGAVTLTDATVRATPGATLDFNTSIGFPINGSTTWSGNLNLEGGGLIEVTNNGNMNLDDATFSVQADTRFEINGNITVGGTGRLTAGTLTARRALFSATFTNDAAVVLAGGGTATNNDDIRFDYGSFNNNGSLTVVSSFVTLGYGFGVTGQWVNGPTGVIEFQTNCYVGQYTGNGLIVNHGTLRVDDGVVSVGIQSAFDNVGGTIDVRSGTLNLPSDRGPSHNDPNTPRGQLFNSFGADPGGGAGLNTGATYNVAAGATLDLRGGDYFDSGSVFAGKFTGTGGGQILIGGRAQMRSADWNFPAGMLQWMPNNGDQTGTFATGIIGGTWTNSGDLTLVASPMGQQDHQTLLYATLTNRGTLTFQSGTRLDLFQDFAGGDSSVINVAGGIITFAGGNLLRGVAPGSLNDVFNPSWSEFQNAGHVVVAGNTNLDALFDNNAGTLDVENGATANIGYYRGSNPGLDSNSIAGEWIVRGGSNINFYRAGNGAVLPVIAGFRGTALVDGSQSSITWLANINHNSGSITVANGANQTLGSFGSLSGNPADNVFTNTGGITLAGGMVSLPGTFAQDQFGTLTTFVGGTPSTLAAGGQVTLGGKLVTLLAKGAAPSATDRFDIVTSPTVVGAFAANSINGFVTLVSPTKVTLAPVTAAADLAVSDIKLIPSAGAELVPGSSFSVLFTIRNLSSVAISSSWTDAVFLSANDQLDSSDILLGRLADAGGLAAYGSRTVTIPLHAPAQPGTWSVFAAADSTVVVPDVNRLNNVAAAGDPLRTSFADLPMDSDVTASFPAGDLTYYRLTIPAGSGPVRITAQFASDNAGSIASRFGELPLGNAGELTALATIAGNGRVASLDIPSGTAGVYFIAVRRATSSPVILRAQLQTLAITGLVNHSDLSGTFQAGDTITLTVLGSGFTQATRFALGGTTWDGSETTATRVELPNANSAVVTFNVPSLNKTLFVGAANGAVPVIYSGKSFTVAASDPSTIEFDKLANWDISVDAPSLVRVRSSFTATVTFRNNSAFSQPAPLLELAATNALLRLPSQSDATDSSLEVLGVKADGRPDDYAPGETGTVQVIVSRLVDVGHADIDFAATVVAEETFVPGLPAGASGPAQPRQGTRQPVALPDGFVSDMRPPTVAQDVWDSAVSGNLTAIVGATYRTYGNAVRAAASVLASSGSDTHDIGRLNTYLMNLADDFGTISSRWRLTAFGLGQDNPFDLHVEMDAENNVLITSGGYIRPFFTLGGGNYAGLGGDRGVLTARPGGGWIITEPDGSVTAFAASGLFDYAGDTLGHRTTAGYTDNLLTTLTDFQGDTTTVAYNAAGRIISITDAVGRTTLFGYDQTNTLLTSITTPAGTTTLEYSTEISGPRAFALIAVTGPDGVRLANDLDDFGRITRTTVGGLLPTTYVYGTGADLGKVTVTDAGGRVSSYVLGEFGKVSHATDALGNHLEVSVDDNGYETGVTSSNIGPVQTPVDDNGNYTAIIAPTGDAIRFTYDNAGVNLTSVRDPLGRQTAYGYTAANLLNSVADSHGTTQYAYDTAGNLTATVTSGGRFVRTTYDAKSLPTRSDYADGSYTTYEYDGHRNLTKVTDIGPGGANPKPVVLGYDGADRVMLVTYSTGKSIGYHYDSAGRVDSLMPSDAPAINYSFDQLGRLSTVASGSQVEVTYAYDSIGRLSSKNFANGTSTGYTYDTVDRVTRIENHDLTGNLVDFQAYTYDPAGQIATLTTPDGITAYGYDLLGQLISVTSPNVLTTTYQYDANGNRLGYGANSADEYTTSPTGDNFTYDADGNLTSSTRPASQSQTQYYYDARGRLYYQIGPAGTFQYEYDALGNRTAVIKNSVRTDLLVDPLGGAAGLSNVLNEYTDGTLSASNILGLGLEGRLDGRGAVSFFQYDILGSAIDVTDATGSVSANYHYDAFGNITSMSGAMAAANPIRFNGKFGIVDRGTGLLEMRNRFYDPASGRFTQLDPLGLIGGDTNEYRFAGNNPVNNYDPSGLRQVNDEEPSPNLQPDPGSKPDQEANREYGASAVRNHAAEVVVSKLVEKTAGATGVKLIERGGGVFVKVLSPAGDLLLVRESAEHLYKKLERNREIEEQVRRENSHAQNLLQVNLNKNIKHKYLAKLSKLASTNPSARLLEQKYLQAHHASPSIAWYLDLFKSLGLHQSGTTLKKIPAAGVHDPNEIIGPAGFGTQGYIQPVGSFQYTIGFENVPTATAPAQVVTITQQLDSDLDWDTFQLQSFGWADKEYQVPAGLQSYHTRVAYTEKNAIVDVNANFNAATGMLAWTFTTLDPVTLDQPADSVTAGFLPPDDANGTGTGFVSYSVQPKANAATGTRYDAKATIVFDTEAPIDTVSIFNTADAGQPGGGVTPLPATVTPSFTVNWSNADDANGSGIATYDVFVSDNGAPFTALLQGTSATSTPFTGVVGHTYAFYAIATDNVGYIQATPATAQATSLVAPPDTTAPSSTMAALPVFTRPSFTVAWSGQDNAGGSGIASFTVYVSDNGGAFVPWQTATSLTSAVYSGSSDHTYSFYTVATDQAGNVESKPAAAQATTQAQLSSPNKLYIDAVYMDLLGRAPDIVGLNYWSGQLDQGGARGTLINLIDHSAEYFGTIIKPAYQQFLGRGPDSGGLAFWIDRMVNGLTDELLEAGFIGSPEYFAHSGGTDKGWVDAMYQNLLGRQPDAQGESFWVGQLAHGANRASVAFGFAASAEREGQHISANYQKYLGRKAGQSEIDYWIDQFVNRGKTNEDVVTGFVSSLEYYRKNST